MAARWRAPPARGANLTPPTATRHVRRTHLTRHSMGCCHKPQSAQKTHPGEIEVFTCKWWWWYCWWWWWGVGCGVCVWGVCRGISFSFKKKTLVKICLKDGDTLPVLRYTCHEVISNSCWRTRCVVVVTVPEIWSKLRTILFSSSLAPFIIPSSIPIFCFYFYLFFAICGDDCLYPCLKFVWG